MIKKLAVPRCRLTNDCTRCPGVLFRCEILESADVLSFYPSTTRNAPSCSSSTRPQFLLTRRRLCATAPCACTCRGWRLVPSLIGAARAAAVRCGRCVDFTSSAPPASCAGHGRPVSGARRAGGYRQPAEPTMLRLNSQVLRF